MSRLPEQFTFSTPETQESFEKLSEIAKQRMIEASMEEAKIIQEKVEHSEASSYSEALEQYRATIESYSEETFEIKGEDAVTILRELFEKEKSMYPPPEGYEVADLRWNKYADLLSIKIFKHEKSTEIREGKIYVKEEYLAGEVNDIGFAPLMSLISKESHPEFKRYAEEIINNSFFNHLVSGWNNDRSREGSLSEVVSDVESDKFTNSRGFFITPTYNSWANRFADSSGNVIYFNDQLMKFMTPSTPEELTVVDSINEEAKMRSHNRSHYPPMAKDLLDSAIRFPSHEEKGGLNEGASELYTILLLAKKQLKLSYFNDELATLFIAPVSIEERGQKGYGRVSVKLRIGPIDPELAKILVTSEAEIIEPGVFQKSLTISYDNEREIDINGKAPILIPIQRIIPSVVTGIIEYEKLEENKSAVQVKRIAIPQGNSFTIYDQNMIEVTKEK